MPRVTRAALRSKELEEETSVTISKPFLLTPAKSRVPLGEIRDNQSAGSIVNTPEESVEVAKKDPAKVKGKKGKATKKTTKQEKLSIEEPSIDVLEDGNQSAASSAVEEACQDLMMNGTEENHRAAMDDQRPHTPPSPAVNTATEQLYPDTPTPHIDHEIPKPDDNTKISAENAPQEDSFVVKVESRTPARVTNVEETNVQKTDDSDKEDSFVEQIKTRTPGKRVSRIEDSVEALDALEEEIEKVDGSLPNATRNLQSPAKAKKKAKLQPGVLRSKKNDSLTTKKATNDPANAETEKPSSNVRSKTSRLSAQPTIKKSRHPASLAPSKREPGFSGPGSEPITSNPRAAPKKRVSSVHKAPFQPVKSTKPPTRAAFELPGDAISRKLKERREERLKREEEEKSKQKVFKARPVRLSQAPEVKLTAATKARLSIAKGDSIAPIKTANISSKTRMSVGPGSTTTAGTNKRLSTLSVAKRSSKPPANLPTLPSANSSAKVPRAPSLNAVAGTRAPSALGTNRPAPTAEDLAHQKSKGKEVFARPRAEIQEREKAKKEKEEAAKKARAEAAERGRVASREWAEKQKLKKMEAAKENGEDKTVVA
ncbi:hypothetical protein MMC28_006924 [Mycoblastus sanguinarius]|nr:hypothetical protein [Mycoblastus sanguinarius]